MLNSSKLQITSLYLYLLFLLITLATFLGFFAGFDPNLMITLQSFLPQYLILPFSLFSLLGSAEITSLIWIGLLVYLLKKRQNIFPLLTLFPLSQLIELFGKTFLYHPPPPQELYIGIFNFSITHTFIKETFSYPSGHMIRTTFLATFISILLIKKLPKNQKLILTSLTIFIFLMLLSRIHLGEHWPSDCLGGLLLGLSFGILATLPLIKTPKSS